MIRKSLSSLQQNIRNAGWRIQWIPWQDEGKCEVVYNTPLTLCTGLGGASLFVTMIWLVVSHRVPKPWIGLGVLGLFVALGGRFYAAWRQQRDWLRIEAICTDREIVRAPTDNGYAWEYRLLCQFSYQGQTYCVTPESSRAVSFTSERAAQGYLGQRIAPDGDCVLWIDPHNPLHAVFHQKKKV